MGIVFTLETSDDDLSVDLEEFYDYVVSNELSFTNEFGQQVLNFLVYTSEDGMRPNFDGPNIMSIHLDQERFSNYIDIDLNDDPNPWIQLGDELEAICSYAHGQKDGHSSDKVVGYLAILADGWKYEEIDAESIDERMATFMGLYASKWDVVTELMERGDLDPIPDWVVYDEAQSAEEAEYSGYFSSYEVSWLYDAVWS